MFKTKNILFGALIIFAILVISSLTSAMQYNAMPYNNPYYTSNSYSKTYSEGYAWGPSVSKSTNYDRTTFYDYTYNGYAKTTIYKKTERATYQPVMVYAPRYTPEFYYYQPETTYGYYPYGTGLSGYNFNNGYCYGGCGSW